MKRRPTKPSKARVPGDTAALGVAAFNEALTLFNAQRYDDALQKARSAAALGVEPQACTNLLNNIGHGLHLAGRLDQAEAALRDAVALSPRAAGIQVNHASILLSLCRYQEASAAAQAAAALGAEPQMCADLLNNIGLGYFQSGQLEQTEIVFRKAVALTPQSADNRANHARVLLELSRHQEASAVARAAAALGAEPQICANILNNIGRAHWLAGQLAEAEAAFRDAVALTPQAADIQANLARVLYDLCRLQEAEVAFRQAVELCPDSPKHRSNLLLTLCYLPDIEPQRLLEEHRAFGARFSHPFDPLEFPNDSDPARRIRLGYVSPDFRRHVVMRMMSGVIAHHDRREVEVFCYAEVSDPDDLTEELRASADHWRWTVGLSDQAVAAMIRADGIDVLVDLAGHTANNRLPVFGLKPAPVQASWLGYPNTTGMPAIDYLLVSLSPDRAVETPIPGPRPLYTPDQTLPLQSLPPCLNRGYVTFGCFNNASKLNSDVVAVWADILKAVPNSRLLLKASGYTEPYADNWVVKAFAARGVEPWRIELRGFSPYQQFMQETADIDLALDPFPYGGASTTFDMLHMGVPVVGLKSQDPRSSISWLLYWVGLRELVAGSWEEYARLAIELANDADRLRGLRRALRNRLTRAGFSDVGRLTSELEGIWRMAWKRWCERKRLSPSP